MDILPGFKLCKKNLHQYPIDKRQCSECRKLSKQKWYQNNKKLCAELRKEWNKNNKDQRNELNKKWKKTNKGKINSINSKRRAIKKQAIPLWANMQKIKEIYVNAHKLTKITGVLHEVDHIYLLQNKYMCGLHVENNLQILTKKENLAKGNRTWPGQLECQQH